LNKEADKEKDNVFTRSICILRYNSFVCDFQISSASNCTDFQSRRLNLKYKTETGDLKHCTTVRQPSMTNRSISLSLAIFHYRWLQCSLTCVDIKHPT